MLQALICPGPTEPLFPSIDGTWPPDSNVTAAAGIAYMWVRLGLVVACFGFIIAALHFRQQRNLGLWNSAGALICVLAWGATVVAQYASASTGGYAASANMAMATGFYGFYAVIACVPLLAAFILFALRVRVVIPTVALAVALAPVSYVLIGWSVVIYVFTCN